MFNFLHFVCAQWNPNKRSGMSSVSILSDGRMDIVICRGDFVPKSNKHFVRPWTKLVLTSLKISLILLVLDIIQTNPITKTTQIKQKQRDFSFLFIFFLFAHHHTYIYHYYFLQIFLTYHYVTIIEIEVKIIVFKHNKLYIAWSVIPYEP